MEKTESKTNITRWVRPNILRMQPYSSAREEFKEFEKDYTFLDANENPFNTKVNRYPDPFQRKLKRLLSQQKDVQEDEILLGNGSDEVLDLIFRVFCEPAQDHIITLPPTYGMYKVLAETNNIVVREIPLTKDFQPNVSAILQSQTQNSKLLFICSPNNPTGNAIDERQIRELVEGFQGIVVIDEAYIDFSTTNSWVSRIGEYNNLIVTQTLSKAYGMAGIRLGICYASSEIIAFLNKIKPPYNINALTQEYAYEQLKDNSKVANAVDCIVSERDRMIAALQGLDTVEKIFPSNANFLLIRMDDAFRRYTELLECGIVVRNRSKLLNCENTLRITIGTPEENTKTIQVLYTLKR